MLKQFPEGPYRSFVENILKEFIDVIDSEEKKPEDVEEILIQAKVINNSLRNFIQYNRTIFWGISKIITKHNLDLNPDYAGIPIYDFFDDNEAEEKSLKKMIAAELSKLKKKKKKVGFFKRLFSNEEFEEFEDVWNHDENILQPNIIEDAIDAALEYNIEQIEKVAIAIINFGKKEEKVSDKTEEEAEDVKQVVDDIKKKKKKKKKKKETEDDDLFAGAEDKGRKFTKMMDSVTAAIKQNSKFKDMGDEEIQKLAQDIYNNFEKSKNESISNISKREIISYTHNWLYNYHEKSKLLSERKDMKRLGLLAGLN